MGTISQKLTYLNDTKGLLKDSINSLGGEITSQTTFRQYATELDSIYASLPKVSGTGSNISLSPTRKGRITSQINGDTEQDGEPTPDNPQEIKSVTGLQKVKVEGKNLFDKDNANILNALITNTGAINSNAITRTLYIPCNPNTTYTISKISSPRFVVGTTENIPSVGSSTLAFSDFSTGTSGTITTGNNAHYLLVYYYNSSGTATEQEILDSTQIEIGNEATEYESYQGQEYEINLGKNLFDIESTDISSSGSSKEVDDNDLILISTTQGTSYTGFNIRNIKPNTEYTLSYNANAEYYAGYQIRSYNKDNVNTSIKELTSATDLSFTFTTPSDTSYLRIYLYASNDSGVTIGQKTTYSNVQLEEGSQSSYSPYFTPIHLYENDQIIGTPNNWSIKNVMNEIIFNGTERWAKGGNQGYFTQINSLIKTLNYTNKIYSNYFKSKERNNLISEGITGYYDPNNDYPNENWIYVSFDDNSMTINEFKTWLSTHNTKVVYELAEPTTTPITNTELIEDLNNFYNAKSYNGQTNISVEGDLPMILDVSAIIGDE